MIRSLQVFRKTAPRSARAACGFSLIETLTLVSLIGIMVAMAIPGSSGIKTAATRTKLASDVTVLNEAVSLYLAEGGSLDGVTNARGVIQRLKTTTNPEAARRHVGPVTGRLVDVRLAARNLTSAEARSGNARAVWNPAQKKFTIATSGDGIGGFYFDDNLASGSSTNGALRGKMTEQRKPSNVLYNGGDGWVWAWGGSSGPAALTPASFPLTDPSGGAWPPPGSGSPAGGGSPPTASTDSAPSAPTKLPTPTILPIGGAFSLARFPGSIVIGSGGAPAGFSMLQYKLDSGPWTDYTGGFPVAPGSRVRARNISLDDEQYLDSDEDSEIYLQLVDFFTGTVIPEWHDVAGGAKLVQATNNKNLDSVVATYGKPTKSSEPPNSLTFKRSAFAGVPPDSDFKIGSLTYYNGTVSNGTAATEAKLKLHIDLTLPSNRNGEADINFTLWSTPNTSDAKASADFAKLETPVTNFKVQADGVTYTLELRFANMSVSQGWVDDITQNVYEGSKGTADLVGRFVSSY